MILQEISFKNKIDFLLKGNQIYLEACEYGK